MRKHRRLTGALALLLAVVLMAAVFPTPAAADGNFADVPSDAWYAEYVNLCAKYGIINGRNDGLFHPDDNMTRGEFMKLLSVISDLVPYNMDSGIHWSQPYWQVLNDNGVLWGLDLACTSAILDTPITRYEMCVMIANLCSNVFAENFIEMASPASKISDYDSINQKYLGAVEQTYGKGILSGFPDGSFQGDKTMTRAEASAVVVRTAWNSERITVSGVTEVKGTGSTTSIDAQSSFAWRYRNMTDYERRQALFGDGNKTYFTGNESNLGDYIVTIQVRTWDIDNAGNKYTRTWNLQVNKQVAAEVQAIFEEIYNDPEKFPIHALGGARFSDTMRHAWGCAIDINPVENYYVNTTTWTALTGNYCYKTSNSPYSIRPDSSVVRAFAKYGWGWGGGTAANDYTGWSTTADYMHFSILSSGG